MWFLLFICVMSTVTGVAFNKTQDVSSRAKGGGVTSKGNETSPAPDVRFASNETNNGTVLTPDLPLECVTGVGKDYRGTKSTTKSGKPCQKWAANKPHIPAAIYTPENNAAGELESNYCRHPRGDSLGPWCYTTDLNTRWEYCLLPKCIAPASCPSSSTPETTCTTGQGKLYRGTIAVTESGKTCQSWLAQSPHIHTFKPEDYPCTGLDKNYCRNPAGDEKPWCYTTDSGTRWEYCSVPICAQSGK